MNFQEAMTKLKSGGRVTRKEWPNSTYLAMNGDHVDAFEYILMHYPYSCETMVSEGWTVDGIDGEFTFPEIIPYLMNGRMAKRADWVDSRIFMDEFRKSIVYRRREIALFTPHFESFIANDWIEL